MNKFSKQHAFRLSAGYSSHSIFGMLFFLLLFCNGSDVWAQRVAVRTNIPDWATLSPNVGFEFALGSQLSLETDVTYSPFRFKDNLYLRQVRIQPEFKYWFETILSRHYVGATAFYANYDLGINDKGFYGDGFGIGLTYGYNWVISRRWNFELSAGVGAIHYRLARYTTGTIHQNPDTTGWMIAPVKLGLSFIYVIR